MKRVLTTLLAAGVCVGTAAAQRGAHNSRPYHPPERQVRTAERRAAPPAKQATANPTSSPSTPGKRGR